MNYQQIVFDVDGTLLDTGEAILRSLQAALLAATGREYPPEELTFSLGITGEDCIRRLGLEVSQVLPLWEKELYQGEYQRTVRLFHGIPETLEALSGAGYGLGIVSSETRAEFEQGFPPFHIGHYFQTFVLADDTAEHKPHAAPLLKLMERTGCPPERVLYIGDSAYDMRCAESAGTGFALAGWGCRQAVDAALVLAHPTDLLKYLNI